MVNAGEHAVEGNSWRDTILSLENRRSNEDGDAEKGEEDAVTLRKPSGRSVAVCGCDRDLRKREHE